MFYVAAQENKKNKSWYERVKFLDCKQTNVTRLIFQTSSVLEVQKKLKWKPCWNVGKSKGIVFQSGSSTSYGHESQNKHNKTISPDLVCSTSAPLDFLPGKLLNWLQRKLNIEARIPQQASSKFMFLHSAVHLCFLVLVFFLLDIFLTHFWRKLHL